MATTMNEALSCPVCYEYLADPKILTCGHTICKICLEDIYRSESSRQLPCPMCRHVTPVPEGDISKLPTNITVRSLVEDLKSATQSDLEKQAEIKIKILLEHADHVIQQKQKVKEAISACRGEIQKAHDEAVAKLAERKCALLRECDDCELELLEKLDKLVQKDDVLVSRISNARELKGNTFQDLGTRYHDTLKDLLKTIGPNLSEATAITRRGEMLHFNKKQVNLDLGEVHEGEMRRKEKQCVELSKSKSMSNMACTPDGRMAVGYNQGGIEIYSAEGELWQTVLEDVTIYDVAFLSDGRCVVRNGSNAISLYTPEWEKLDVRFSRLNEGGGLAVDCDDLIYVGYCKAKKIRVFRPSDGKAIREIPCGRYQPFQISAMEPSKMLVITTQYGNIRVLDQQGKEVHSVTKDGHTYSLYATVCKNGTILIAAINYDHDRVSIKQYTREMKYVRTLITDHVIEDAWWHFLRELSSGVLALCSGNRIYIFYNTVSHPEE